MNQSSYQRFCAWSGLICVTLFFIAFGCAGFIPPMSPSLDVEQVAAHYRDHTTGIRVGMGIMLISSMFYASFTGVISGQMRRIPGLSPTVIYTQLAAGALASVTFMMPAILFLATSFRPERAPEMTYAMNDLSWIMLVIPWPPFMMQNFAFAQAILSDVRAQPLFPRWLGFMNIWVPISFTPGILLPFFKSGPFAWNGLLVLWIPAAIFILWFAVTTKYLLRAIGDEVRVIERDAKAGNPILADA